jgi:hypothetical protein
MARKQRLTIILITAVVLLSFTAVMGTANALTPPQQMEKMGLEGFDWSEVPGKGPVKKIGEPYNVYHSFDEPVNGIQAQLNAISYSYPHIAAIEKIGKSVQKRPILAVRLTNEKICNSKKTDCTKPRVLFVATQQARAWISTEMAMRLIKYLTANYGSSARVTELLDTTEVWIVPVVNPDGYQYTFTNQRLWRKNLRDNDGDGQITLADGVDLNRNFDSHWGFDNEGSSPVPSDQTYRGTAPNSEPETQALVDLVLSQDFKFVVSYDAHGDMILYPWNWQIKTTSLDDPIFVAQAGTDANPSIYDSLASKGYSISTGADLYTMNGSFTDWCYGIAGVPAYRVLLSSDYDFLFPDDEAMVQTVFEDNLEFALSVAESAVDPAHPISPVGIVTNDIYHTPLTTSYGQNQIVEVLARKGLDLTLSYSINGGDSEQSGFIEKLGVFYNEKTGVYYSRYVSVINNQGAGDNVSYRIIGDSSELGPYSYSVVSATGNPILIMAAEDYTGLYPTYSCTVPCYLSYYTDALDSGSYSYDIFDIDAQGVVPSFAEVLSHYDVVIWYTGDDYFPEIPNESAHEAEFLNLRDYMNYSGGKLFATGQDISWSSAFYGLFSDDFFQYYLGSYIHGEGAGMDTTGVPFDVTGEAGDPVFGGLTFSLYGGDGANNQHYADSFLPTSDFLPHFSDVKAARYDRPPHSGDYFIYSNVADMAFKRLGGTFTLPGGSPKLTFWTSYNIEFEWDFAFVEIHEVGTDTWTTLPDLNGLTIQDTGESCTSGWVEEIHPFLAHYMDDDCNPSGTTGQWNAFTGGSGGWQQVEMDLSAYAGKTVEIYISYASDWSTENFGVLVDDIELSGYPLEDFEAGMGLWASSTAQGSSALNNWERLTSNSLPNGSAIRTPNSVYLGFGFEAIDTSSNRATVMDRIMQYLGQ